jgi:signal transduction histidine kinase
MKQRSLATRLAGLYASLLGVTVVLVILASSLALVYELSSFSRDMVIAKHEEARVLTEQYKLDGQPLTKAAPAIAASLSGLGMRIAVYDQAGHYLAGDKTLHPPMLDRLVRGGRRPNFAFSRIGAPLEFMRPTNSSPPPLDPRGAFGPGRPESFQVTAVDGGYVAFEPSGPLLWLSLMPYWRVVVTIAVVAIALSWFVGRLFARQALRPIAEITDSLRALAGGDFTQRRFVTPGGDEIGTLTLAYNDAAAGVAAAMDERRHTEERMRQFVADAGHELRTPLTVISGYIDVLRRGALAEPTIARQILGTMSIEKEHMRGLIDRLVRLARLDSERPPMEESINLAELLRNQCDAARRLDETREIDYSVDGIESVVADRVELSEALWNVVENALKYAPDSPVHLRATRTDGRATIVVRDEGPGMTESERLHAFERFYRGDQRGEITGSGLGLSIAKRAVERAGGSIDLASAPNRGTIVTITL